MDADYARNSDRDGEPTRAFEPSLFVWATVMSRPAEDRAIVDAGLKALAFDSGPPLVCDEPAATYERASDEHGRLAVAAATNRLGLGDKIRLIPGHCDPTVNLYDWYVCIRGGRVEQLWPITARGARFLTWPWRGRPPPRRLSFAARGALSRVWFVQLVPGHRLDVDVGFVLAGLREVVGHLQPQPGLRAAAECLIEADRHVRRNAALAVDQIVEGLTRHAQCLRGLGDRQAERFDAVVP